MPREGGKCGFNKITLMHYYSNKSLQCRPSLTLSSLHVNRVEHQSAQSSAAPHTGTASGPTASNWVALFTASIPHGKGEVTIDENSSKLSSASPLEGYWKQNNPSFEWMWTFILLKLRSIAQSKTRSEEMENCEKKQARGSKGRKHKLCISVKMTLLCLACSRVFKCQKSHRR